MQGRRGEATSGWTACTPTKSQLPRKPCPRRPRWHLTKIPPPLSAWGNLASPQNKEFTVPGTQSTLTILLTMYLLNGKKSGSRVRLFVTPWSIQSVHGLLQARILEWVAFPFSRGSSQPRSNPSLPHCRRIIYQLSDQETSLENRNASTFDQCTDPDYSGSSDFHPFRNNT